jgi:hypothetical protein
VTSQQLPCIRPGHLHAGSAADLQLTRACCIEAKFAEAVLLPLLLLLLLAVLAFLSEKCRSAEATALLLAHLVLCSCYNASVVVPLNNLLCSTPRLAALVIAARAWAAFDNLFTIPADCCHKHTSHSRILD